MIMSKKVNKINGVRIIKRYSFGSFVSGILALLLAAIPVVWLFLPFFTLTIPETSYATLTLTKSVNALTGLDLFKYIFQQGLGNTGALIEAIANGGPIPQFALIESILFLSLGAIFIIICLLALYYLIVGMEYIFRGRIMRYKLPYGLGWLYFILMLLFVGGAFGNTFVLSLQFNAAVKAASEGAGTEVLGMDLLISYIMLGVSFLCMILLGIFYAACFKNRVYIEDTKDLSRPDPSKASPALLGYDAEGRPVYAANGEQEPFLVKEVTKVVTKVDNGLPRNIRSIGGHAFAENMNLEVAVIPVGIQELGNGAFANCGNLKIVSIPTSVKKIGENCFFNTPKLKRINYAGSKVSWRHIKRGKNWLYKAGTYNVVCTDGEIIVNPLK